MSWWKTKVKQKFREDPDEIQVIYDEEVTYEEVVIHYCASEQMDILEES